MAITDAFRRARAGELRLCRGRVLGIEPSGQLRVRIGSGDGEEMVCDVLRAGDGGSIRLEVGVEVVVACPEEASRPGVILGAVGPVDGSAASGTAASGAHTIERGSPGEPLLLRNPEIVLEAGEQLTLRCGEASIRITRDGKIVISAQHVLSRAKGTQRIKGGSVAIN